jgi:hypothetical protein
LKSDDPNAVLRQAEKIPEAAEAARAIRVKAANTVPDAIYPLTDIVNSIADKLGMTRANSGRSATQAVDNSGA